MLTPPQCLSPCGLSAMNMALPDFTELASHHSDLSLNVILSVTCSSILSIQSCSSALLLISLPVFLTILLALILPVNSFVAPILYVSITESFRIWNSSTGIPSPPLALFKVLDQNKNNPNLISVIYVTDDDVGIIILLTTIIYEMWNKSSNYFIL